MSSSQPRSDRPQFNLSYDPKIPARRYDYFPSTTLPATPPALLVFLHGGGWVSGDKTMYHDEAEWYAAQGVACACVQYRLAPLYPFPHPVQDVLAFVAHIKTQSNLLNFDPRRVIAFGNSAGGHLACMAGLCQPSLITTSDRPDPDQNSTVDGVVSICAITDIRDPRATQYPIASSFLSQFIPTPPESDPAPWAAASPVTHVTPHAPPFMILHGDQDDVVPPDQARALYSALCQAGVPAELHILPGEGHSFTLATWLEIRRLTLGFIQTI